MLIKPGKLLAQIDTPDDLKKFSKDQLVQISEELRQFLVDNISVFGGHFGAGLGVVELTVALHYVFNTPEDQLVWDVGHQAYGHKILTGRRNVFHTNRLYKGISGFPKRSESVFDTFGVGHSSTSISAALGMAAASKYQGDSTRQHVAVIGDGALTAGMAFEAIIGENPAQVGMAREENAIKIVSLSLEPAGPRVDPGYRGNRSVLVGLGFEADALVPIGRQEMVNDVETLLARGIVHAADVDDRFVSVIARDGREYLIPNEEFITREVINWSYSDDLVRIDVPFRASYDADPHKISAVAIEAATTVPRVVDAQLPACWMTAFGRDWRIMLPQR